MALYWNFNEKCGEATFLNVKQDKTFTINLYEGNAFLIFLNEYQENGKDMYDMYSFFVDEAHAKRCLGLDKTYGKDNIFDDGRVKLVGIKLDKSRCKANKIINLLVKAFDELEIKLYKEDN